MDREPSMNTEGTQRLAVMFAISIVVPAILAIATCSMARPADPGDCDILNCTEVKPE